MGGFLVGSTGSPAKNRAVRHCAVASFQNKFWNASRGYHPCRITRVFGERYELKKRSPHSNKR